MALCRAERSRYAGTEGVRGRCAHRYHFISVLFCAASNEDDLERRGGRGEEGEVR